MGPGGSVNISDPNDSTLRCLHRLDNVVCTAVFQVRLYFPEVTTYHLLPELQLCRV